MYFLAQKKITKINKYYNIGKGFPYTWLAANPFTVLKKKKLARGSPMGG